MSEDHVQLHLGGELTIEALADAFVRFSQVLDAVQECHNAAVRWVLTELDHGSASASARAVPLDDEANLLIPAMRDTFISAAQHVQNGNADFGFPPHRQMYELMALASGNHLVAVQANGKEVVVNASLGHLEPEKQTDDIESVGTVLGRVETLSRRNGLSFNLYELVTNRAVKCHLAQDLEETMREVWGRLAEVTGTVGEDAETGRPLWIRNVTRVDLVEEGDPEGYRKARGAIQTSEPAEVLVRRMRDDEYPWRQYGEARRRHSPGIGIN